MITIRVLVAADEALARAGLAALLADEDDIRVVASLAEPTAEDLDFRQPDIVISDLGWDAEDVLARLPLQAESGAPVLALLPDADQAGAAWRAGARGLLPRETSRERLLVALRAMAAGLAVVDDSFAAAVNQFPSGAPAQLAEPLTPRELEVLQLLAEGLSNRAIGLELDITGHTVKFHVNALMGKLGAQSRTEAVVKATRLGLIVL